MKKTLAITLCAAMAAGMIGTCTTAFAADAQPDPAADAAAQAAMSGGGMY